MGINLSLNFSHPDAIANRVRYRRIDNSVNPNWITVSPDPITSPATVATNLDNGQYQLGITAIYPDGRSCTENFLYTDACPSLISINAYITGNTIVVQYLAPSAVPKVRITINFPNGGSYTQNYVNTGDDIAIALPNGVYGTFSVSGQSVCDEATSFFSTSSSLVSVDRSQTNTQIINSANGTAITVVSGIDGFALSSNLNFGDSTTGTHTAFYGPISITFTGEPDIASSATLSLNNTVIQCVNIPNTDGGVVNFAAANFSSTDNIVITFAGGLCP